MADKSKRTRRGGKKHQEGRQAAPVKTPNAGRNGGRIWLYGNHAVLAAIGNPARRKHRLVLTGDSARYLENARIDGAADVVAEVMERRDIDRLLPPGAVHQGMALQADPLDPVTLGEVIDRNGDEQVVVVLDQPNDPQNIGAVLRSASAFGAAAVIVPDRHAPEATAALAKAASGALDRVPLIRVTNLARALEQLKSAGFWCAGLAADGEQTLSEVDWAARTALVLGAEGTGLRRLTEETCDFLVRIAIDADAGSLNLSAAAAITLYEVNRARSVKG